MPIKSLNTQYAGCHFRSRLEARWAVFLDNVALEWEYEPQGFEVGHRLQGGDPKDADRFNYLPDFWLPEYEAWFEVKGSLNQDELWRLLSAAASLSSNDGGGCHDDGGNDLIVAGPLTHSHSTGVPMRLHMHKGDLEARCMFCPKHGRNSVIVANDSGDCLVTPDTLLAGFYCQKHSIDPVIELGLHMARTARFEFGRRR